MFFLQFDRAVCGFINNAARHWEWLDHAAVVMSDSDLIKGGLILAVFWAMWFGYSGARERLLAGLGGSLLALSIARVLACVLPVRQRPLLEPSMHFVAPLGLPDQSNWTNWSSFPSDHAALFFAIVTGIWLANRRAGMVVLLYFLIAICLPRVYVGIHYPTDIFAGMLIGFGAVLLLQWRLGWTKPILRALERFPGWGYALFFLLTFQIATLFWDVRIILSYFGVST